MFWQCARPRSKNPKTQRACKSQASSLTVCFRPRDCAFFFGKFASAPLRGRRLQFPRFRIKIGYSVCHAVGVLAVNTFSFNAIDRSHSLVIARLNTSECVVAVHDEGLAINYRTSIKPRGEQIT